MIPSRVAIIGWGASGKSAQRVLSSLGCSVCVFDQETTDAEAVKLGVIAIPDPVDLAKAVVDWSPQVVVVSPGVPEISPLFQTIVQSGLPIWGEVELAWRLQEAGPAQGRPWLCVTGTNGKTTTVGLLTAILQAGGELVAEVGNVGLPITSQVDSAATVFAVEVSSFQLASAYSLQPQASLCLNLDSDHLDWHGSLERYRHTKGRVFDGTQRARIFFEGDGVVGELAANAARTNAPLLAISRSIPKVGQIGIDGDWIVDSRGPDPVRLVDLKEIVFLGKHGWSSALLDDVLGAIALARVHGVSPAAVQAGLAAFRLDSHRQSLVAQHDRVRWIDDSKATNAHSAVAALRDLAPGTAVWIAGGDPKGQDFQALVAGVVSQLKAVILIGLNRDLLRTALAALAPLVPVFEIEDCPDRTVLMAAVVEIAARLSSPGDSVVLAPACASWDQFENYSQRGDLYAEEVRRHLGVMK